MPAWLGSVESVIGSEELPLDFYRATSQHHGVLRVIRKNLFKLCLGLPAIVAEKNAVSHEALRRHTALRVIKRFLVKKCLELSDEVAEKKGDFKVCLGLNGAYFNSV